MENSSEGNSSFMKVLIAVVLTVILVFGLSYSYFSSEEMEVVEEDEEFLLYETETFSLEYPGNWGTRETGNFIASDLDYPITFVHFTGDGFHPVIWSKDLGIESYKSSQGINWEMYFAGIDEEFVDEYAKGSRLIQVNGDDDSLNGFFVYEYDEIANPDAVEQLKKILDSYVVKDEVY